MGGQSFLTKTRAIFIAIRSFAFLYTSRNQVFVTNTDFVTFQDIENNQEYKAKHNFIIIEIVQLFF